jgi:alpha-tubulin suppressor-like RCC1 family protein
MQFGEAKIHGWGNNKQGQLGIYGLNNVHEPKQIPLPDINQSQQEKKDYIINVDCGKRHSSFITKNGQIWVTGNYVPEKPQVVEERKELFDSSELTKDDIKAI